MFLMICKGTVIIISTSGIMFRLLMQHCLGTLPSAGFVTCTISFEQDQGG